MFNEEIKRRFLNDFHERYNKVFRVSEIVEAYHNNDIYNFSLEQLQELFHWIDFTSHSTAIRYKNMIKNYINWAINQGCTEHQVNVLESIDNEWMKQFIRKGSVQNGSM